MTCVEVKKAVSIARPTTENARFKLKRLKLRSGSRGKVCKDSVRSRVAGCPSSWSTVLWRLMVRLRADVSGASVPNLVPASLNASVLVGSMQFTSPRVGLQYLQNDSWTWVRMSSTALEKELKTLDFVLRLNYHSVLLLDYFPLCLHFLTSLNKFVLRIFGESLGG